MKNCRSITSILGFVMVFIVPAAAAADAPKLAFKFTTVKVPGAVQTFTLGVNNAGVTVGAYIDKNNVYHGYILNGKKLTKLDDPNGTSGSTGASNLALDGAIRVVGTYTSSTTGNAVGFLYHGGKFTDVPGPTGALTSQALGINDSGAIVGSYCDSTRCHGFLLKGTSYTTLDVPGAVDTFASGINKRGWIVLFWQTSSSTYESVLTKDNGKTYKTINVPGATSSQAVAINVAGDVTYSWLDSNSLGHGALLHHGKYYKFNYPKSVFTYALGINDKNVFAGQYEAQTGGPFSGYKATYK
jgi:uncharacterized membrane protein